jgi:hypothetical protein
MPGALNYLRESLSGALLVMLGRPEGLGRLDLSLAGFWRSFAALILVLPLAFIPEWSMANVVAEEGEVPPGFRDWLFSASVVSLVDWFAFPLLFAFLARPLGLSDRYVPFIVARNWSAVVLAAINALVALPYGIGLTSLGVTTFLVFGALGLTLYLAYQVARVALAISATTACLVVTVEFSLSLVIGLGLGPIV